MPLKFKPSQTVRDKSGKAKTEHFYMKSTLVSELTEALENKNTGYVIFVSAGLVAAIFLTGICWLIFDLLFGKEGTKGLAEVPYTSPISGKVYTAKRSRTEHIV